MDALVSSYLSQHFSNIQLLQQINLLVDYLVGSPFKVDFDAMQLKVSEP